MRSSARAHTHIYTHSHTLRHTHTHFHASASTYRTSHGIENFCTLRYFLGFHCQGDPSELFATLSEVPFLPLFSLPCLPPTPTSRTNLWNPCRVPPVTHNACSSHGQHRRPPKVLMFGDPLCYGCPRRRGGGGGEGEKRRECKGERIKEERKRKKEKGEKRKKKRRERERRERVQRRGREKEPASKGTLSNPAGQSQTRQNVCGCFMGKSIIL